MNGGNDVVNFYDTDVLDRAELQNTSIYMVYENLQSKWKRVTGSSMKTVNMYASNSGVDVANEHYAPFNFSVNYFGGWIVNDVSI